MRLTIVFSLVACVFGAAVPSVMAVQQAPVTYTWTADITTQSGKSIKGVVMVTKGGTLQDAFAAYNGKYKGCTYTYGPVLK